MRKQTKLAVVLAAAALLAVGSASMVSASGWVQEGAEWRYQDASGDYVTEVMKKSGDTTFYLDENGYMAKDYFCNYNENYYYFGSNGAMVRNTWVAIDPSLVDSGDDDVDAYWYYFQDTGKAFKGGDSDIKKKKIDGKTYFFNSDGQMLTGWFDSTGEKFDVENDNDFVETAADTTVYYAGDDGVARAGWLAYTDGLVDEKKIGNDNIDDRSTIYFYFNTSNFKRLQGKEKTINGKKYRFNESGIMMTGWEYLEGGEKGLADYTDYVSRSTKSEFFKYYSGEDDGHLVKKGWVYAVPSEIIDSEKNYDDEEAYFYFSNNGEMVKGQQKRINGKYYIFAGNGVMKTGLVFLNSANEYAGKIDLEYTNGADWIKDAEYYTGDPAKNTKTKDEYAKLNADAKKNETFNGPKYFDLHTAANSSYSIHYYGSDGAKVTGNKIPIEFADDTFIFASKNSGGFLGEKKKKFYSQGFLLKASDDIRLGLVMASDNQARKCVYGEKGFTGETSTGEALNYVVNFGANVSETTHEYALYCVTTSGAKKKKGAYKDADGNYWLVNENKCVVGIYDVQVKYTTSGTAVDGVYPAVCQWKGNVGPNGDYTVNETLMRAGSDGKDDTYIDFGHPDKNGKTEQDHLVVINNDYCLNFTIK